MLWWGQEKDQKRPGEWCKNIWESEGVGVRCDLEAGKKKKQRA